MKSNGRRLQKRKEIYKMQRLHEQRLTSANLTSKNTHTRLKVIMNNIKIVSKGTPATTEIFVVEEGKPDRRLDTVVKVVINPITPDKSITATVTFNVTELDIDVGIDDVRFARSNVNIS